ncbi:MAG: hypothetical protein C4B59_10325 [Candidatus Methanogaster sp.]|uniref:Uncharacterized protein n=1 Tax=Candidatus Methanogaster sp. TaxID=3386292 RepID=A0AC61L1R2_9EURY|nr:MAG: hypothetical protein C4B59_10325 [ANME-2 cluster archaeon]
MNVKRLVIATILGTLCGLFCMCGAMTKFPEEFGTFMLIGIVYNRALIGIVIGTSDNIDLHPALRGAIIGIVVSMAMAIFSCDSDSSGALMLLAFGLVYGVLIDVVTSRLEDKI